MSYARHSRMGWQPVGAIAGSISANPTGAFTDTWVEWLLGTGGSYQRAAPTDLIPAGSQCRFYCSCTANSGGGTAWSIAITVIDLFDGVLKDYAIATTGTNVDLSQTGKLVNNLTNTPWVMPTHDMQLSWHLWASFDASPSHTLLDAGDPSMYY
jgi:hypothetical protein